MVAVALYSPEPMPQPTAALAAETKSNAISTALTAMTTGDLRNPRMQPGRSLFWGGMLFPPLEAGGRRNGVDDGRVSSRLSGFVRRGCVGIGFADISGEPEGAYFTVFEFDLHKSDH